MGWSQDLDLTSERYVYHQRIGNNVGSERVILSVGIPERHTRAHTATKGMLFAYGVFTLPHHPDMYKLRILSHTPRPLHANLGAKAN